MAFDTFPITPPQERFKRWENDIINDRENVDYVLDCAWKDGFHAGADQELEACVEWVVNTRACCMTPGALRDARRPKPPSLKEQALALLQSGGPRLFNNEMQNTIRRALEALPE